MQLAYQQIKACQMDKGEGKENSAGDRVMMSVLCPCTVGCTHLFFLRRGFEYVGRVIVQIAEQRTMGLASVCYAALVSNGPVCGMPSAADAHRARGRYRGQTSHNIENLTLPLKPKNTKPSAFCLYSRQIFQSHAPSSRV